MISNEQLRAAFLSPAMKFYFDRKLTPLSSDEINARIEEMLKYLNMSIHDRGEIPFSPDIDEVWHYWILETQEYALLCQKLHGGHFIHHTSIDYVMHAQPEAAAAEFDLVRGLGVLSSYVLNYGPFAADRVQYWPLVQQLMKHLSLDLEALNAWLASVHGQNDNPLASSASTPNPAAEAAPA